MLRKNLNNCKYFENSKFFILRVNINFIIYTQVQNKFIKKKIAFN